MENVVISSFSLNYIHGKLNDDVGGGHWDISCIYSYLEEGNKNKMWELIKELSKISIDNWLCFGDLNDTMENSKTIRGSR